MALTTALEQARRETATRANREAQMRAERRISEIIKVSGIADHFDRADRKGDLRIETAFGQLYHAATTERMRELIVAAYVAWQQDERDEEAAVHHSVDDAVTFLKVGNPIWLDGAAVPAGSDGAA